jgi:hypothetical protein
MVAAAAGAAAGPSPTAASDAARTSAEAGLQDRADGRGKRADIEDTSCHHEDQGA